MLPKDRILLQKAWCIPNRHDEKVAFRQKCLFIEGLECVSRSSRVTCGLQDSKAGDYVTGLL